MLVEICSVKNDPEKLEVKIEGRVFRLLSKKLFKNYLKYLKECNSQKEVEDLLYSIEKKMAKKHAYQLLSLRAYPSVLLSQKLQDKGIRKSIIEVLVKELTKCGYVDDEKYLDYMIEKYFQKGWGPKYIRYKLEEKNFPRQIVEKKIQEILTPCLQKKKILALIQKKAGKSKPQIYTYLLRKGFSSDLIMQLYYEKT